MLAGRWPLDWYYRCNIVNNIPLSWCARGPHESRYLAGQFATTSGRPTSAQQYRTLFADPSQALPVFTVEYSFFGRARPRCPARSRRARPENTKCPHIILRWAEADHTLTAIPSPILYRELPSFTYSYAYVHGWPTIFTSYTR